MNVTYLVRVSNAHINTLRHLGCVERVDTDENGHLLAVRLKDDCTDGNTIARNGEWLGKFDNGRWQRFGRESYFRLVRWGEDSNDRY